MTGSEGKQRKEIDLSCNNFWDELWYTSKFIKRYKSFIKVHKYKKFDIIIFINCVLYLFEIRDILQIYAVTLFLRKVYSLQFCDKVTMH